MTDFIILGSKITVDGDCSHEIKRHLLLGRKAMYDKPRQHIKKQKHYFANKDTSSQSYDFSSSHLWMWELDHKESWVLKNWCFWFVDSQLTVFWQFQVDIKGAQPYMNTRVFILPKAPLPSRSITFFKNVLDSFVAQNRISYVFNFIFCIFTYF